MVITLPLMGIFSKKFMGGQVLKQDLVQGSVVLRGVFC
jgi:hypothetical protein